MNQFIIDNVNAIDDHITSGLKNFQKATVDRIDELFQSGQNRVLVADEVGMGKTMIARAVISRIAKLRIKERDDLCKIIYICSNQAIARQNIKTLNIVKDALDKGWIKNNSRKPLKIVNKDIDTADTRLSMQHLKVVEQENNNEIKKFFIQLIALTPGTSFETGGGGNASERALMYVILSKVRKDSSEYKITGNIDFTDKESLQFLKQILQGTSRSITNWDNEIKRKENKLDTVLTDLEETRKEHWLSENARHYPDNIIAKLKNRKVIHEEYTKNKEVSLLEFIKRTIDLMKSGNEKDEKRCFFIIKCLRKAFIDISIEMLNPDFIIMDEFQRFNSLLQTSEEDDCNELAHKFLQEHEDNTKQLTRILLLSATPYKLYSTMEEISTGDVGEAYKEFHDVMNFLLSKDKETFHKHWKEYEDSLAVARELGFKELKIKKIAAEDELYKATCRTERLSVMENTDFIDDSSKKTSLAINEGDILSYYNAQLLINECELSGNVNTDYIKSCPYIMSFMENYILKDNIRNRFIEGIDLALANKKLLWIDAEKIKNYTWKSEESNARLEKLKDLAFENNAPKLLWVPPCKPYYPFEGEYKGLENSNFTKTLIFSAWEMVPRMISTMISYEQELKTLEGRKTYSEYKVSGLKFDLEKSTGEQNKAGFQLFSEIYPSSYLADIYKPLQCLNNGLQIGLRNDKKTNTIRDYLYKEIITKLGITIETEDKEIDNRWFIYAYVQLDGKEQFQKWLEEVKNQAKDTLAYSEETDDSENDEEKKEREDSDKRFKNCIGQAEIISNLDSKDLGRVPSELIDTLVNSAIAGFAICYYRSLKGISNIQNVLCNATKFGREFIKNFNTPEFFYVIQSITKKEYEKNYLDRVYSYCINGCFQGMLDEYIQLLQKGKDDCSIQEDLINNLSVLGTSHYKIDTYSSFKDKVILERKRKDNPSEKGEDTRFNMRSHYAVCFSETTDKGNGNRKENLRNAFNSPLRPFVLASTSVGQEGLDFHNYCRRIMHWNLPTNPVDLEQREGRINRYKCLAIRQNVARLHGEIPFESGETLWNEMFQRTYEIENGGKHSELIPYWVYGKNQQIKLERIVPIYPLSSDYARYERLIKILSLYRMTLGQPRQEELLEYVYSNFKEEDLKDLFINLSPWSKRKL